MRLAGRKGERRTASQKAIFGQDGDRVDEEDDDWKLRY